jgi:uncharacterized protein
MMRVSKTALFRAASAWDAASLNSLLEAAPGLISGTDPKGRTALHLVCSAKPRQRANDPDGIGVAAALLEAGADLEAAMPVDADEGDFRATPLWFAIARGENLPLAKFLLERGADPSSSLWAVVWRDDERLCRLLLSRKPRLDLKAHGETPIFYAARLRKLKTLDLLIQAGADPAVVDNQGRDALDIARARGLPEAVVESLAHRIGSRRGR